MRLLTLFFCLLFSDLIAQSPFVYDDKDKLIPLEKGAAYFVDSTKTMSFDAVRHLPLTAFRVNQKEAFNLGNTNLPVWLRLDFDNRTSEELYLMLENHETRYVDAYLLNQRDSVVKTWQAGVARPHLEKVFLK
jgi:two-component system, sensor histidine kinase LadS